ncbi:MAG: alpha/beta hydrolase [Clostridiales bacterium]|nr:alpha/beta hydrolase [Clostridiales bacterium]
MQGWMIALIVIASVIVLLAILTPIGGVVALNATLGRRDKHAMKSESPEKYGVDTSWFDEVEEYTEHLNMEAYDGVPLSAMLLRHKVDDGAESIKRVALLQHGYWASPRSMQPYAKIFWEKGYDVLMPYARAHGASGGKYVGMAWIDRFDVMRWIDRTVEMYGKDIKILTMGVSMGGSTVAAVSGMNPPSQVKCVIDDCGFSSQKEEYYACVNKVPLPRAISILPLVIGVRFGCGYSVYDADIKPLVAQSKLPTLFIHGKNDTFVPCALGQKLYDACGATDKQFELFDATHAASFASDRDRYTALISEFADKYIA